jgi:hypothetical protein
MNGVLLFGWSVAVIFEVLRRTMAIKASAADSLSSVRDLPGEPAYRSPHAGREE